MAETAVKRAIPKLHKLGVVTKRPDDYFAQMIKSDDHMRKVSMLGHIMFILFNILLYNHTSLFTLSFILPID